MTPSTCALCSDLLRDGVRCVNCSTWMCQPCARQELWTRSEDGEWLCPGCASLIADDARSPEPRLTNWLVNNYGPLAHRAGRE